MKSETPPSSSRESRDSIPPLLARLQAWMESEHLLRKLLPVEGDAPIRVLRIRRNFKFRKITVESGGATYICYIHHWPRGLRNLAWFSSEAQKLELHVPQPLLVRTRWRDLIRDHAFSLVVPYIEGAPLNDNCSEETLTALGDALGRLQAITADAHGPLLSNFASRGHYWPALKQYWRQTARQLRTHAAFASDPQVDRVMVWLLEQGQFLESVQRFHLTHGDPAGGNFLITTEGQLYFIDCDRIGFEPGPLELANALLQNYCGDDGQRRFCLSEAYLKSCPPECRELWEQHAQFFIASALVWRTQRKLQWAIKRPDKGRSMERAAEAWRCLPLVLQARPPNWQAALALLGD